MAWYSVFAWVPEAHDGGGEWQCQWDGRATTAAAASLVRQLEEAGVQVQLFRGKVLGKLCYETPVREGGEHAKAALDCLPCGLRVGRIC